MFCECFLEWILDDEISRINLKSRKGIRSDIKVSNFDIFEEFPEMRRCDYNLV
jgi:hypothetical protein